MFWPEDWSAHWLDEITTLSGIVAVSAAVYFHVVLLREFGPPLWVMRIHHAILAMLPLKLVLLFVFQQSMLALQINMGEVLFSPVIFFVSVFFLSAWNRNQTPDRPVLARWVVLSKWEY